MIDLDGVNVSSCSVGKSEEIIQDVKIGVYGGEVKDGASPFGEQRGVGVGVEEEADDGQGV